MSGETPDYKPGEIQLDPHLSAEISEHGNLFVEDAGRACIVLTRYEIDKLRVFLNSSKIA